MTSFHEQPLPGSLSHSEDDNPSIESEHGMQEGKRGTRACDRCRKIKSKCEATAGRRCKNCEVADTPCTYHGPSFKRGPPKGYIHSIEQRWHQVECILATIMESPRAQDIIHDLRTDSFANAILDRVQAGPYGSSSRLQQRQEPTSESFYSSLMDVPQHSSVKDDRRTRRQSRVSREIVSQDLALSTAPTKEWQDQLARRIAHTTRWAYTASPTAGSSSSVGGSSDYSRTRRRLDWPLDGSMQQRQPNWDKLYTISDPQSGLEPYSVDETAEAFGHLSVDHNKEFRYHGPASGLPLLAQSRRKPGQDVQDNRIWEFMNNIDPEAPPYDLTSEEEDVEVRMPSIERQNTLLQLYFTYVHPFFPVIHKQDFLYQYHALSHPKSASPATRTALKRHPMQRPCKMLLLAMFAIAARYSSRPEDHPTYHGGGLSKAGQEYAEDAHKLLDKKYQSSRPSTCQALLLLAIREFGMGAMDKGWLYSGMAQRMAVDLGMNRNADGWTTDGKQPLFTHVEKQIRRHIWWSCCISDKLSAVWLGRPITFRANDHSTPLPDADEVDETELWQPYPPDIIGDFPPRPANLMTSFREACQLSKIITDIMDKIYPVQPSSEIPRRLLFEQLETRLTKWLIQLPEHLRYPPNDRHAQILPHVMMLHIEYQAAVLLLHRAFLPDFDENVEHSHASLQSDPLALKAFDVCSGAAIHICSMTELYNEKFGLEKAPAFLCIYLQSAGIMHVVTLSRRPRDPQATLGLTRCIAACRRMEKLWPTATRLRNLLEGAKIRLDESVFTVNSSQTERRKRSVEDALGSSKNPDVSGREMYDISALNGYSDTRATWDHDHNTRMVAHTLGVDGPGAQTSTSFYPGHQWWPTQLLTTQGLTHMALNASMDVPSVSAPMSYSHLQGYVHPQHQAISHGIQPSGAQHEQGPQEPFTFGQDHLSHEFAQGVNYPGFDLSRYGHHDHSRQESTQPR